MDQEGIASEYSIPAYSKISGILALITAIVGAIVPVVGVTAITPLAIILGAAALYGGCKGFGIATIIIVTVNLIISPSFWVNVWIGSNHSGISRGLTYFDVLGVLMMLGLVVKPKKNKESK